MDTPLENVKAERIAVAGRKIAHLEEKNERLCAENERLREALAAALEDILNSDDNGAIRIIKVALAEKDSD